MLKVKYVMSAQGINRIVYPAFEILKSYEVGDDYYEVNLHRFPSQLITVAYFKNHKRHREDGPAIIHFRDDEKIYVNDSWHLDDLGKCTEGQVFQRAIENKNEKAINSILFKKYLKMTL